MPRAFVAICPPLAMRGTLVACREAFLDADPAWRGEKWVADENLHVTVRFLGDVPEAGCGVLIERLHAAVHAAQPYRLRLDIARAIPRPRSASLLWVAASAGMEQTADVAARVADAVSYLDFEPDGRAFKTHLTLCRARHPRRVSPEALDEMERILHRANDRATSMSVREVTLFASTLTPRGPVYEQLAVIPLGE